MPPALFDPCLARGSASIAPTCGYRTQMRHVSRAGSQPELPPGARRAGVGTLHLPRCHRPVPARAQAGDAIGGEPGGGRVHYLRRSPAGHAGIPGNKPGLRHGGSVVCQQRPSHALPGGLVRTGPGLRGIPPRQHRTRAAKGQGPARADLGGGEPLLD